MSGEKRRGRGKGEEGKEGEEGEEGEERRERERRRYDSMTHVSQYTETTSVVSLCDGIKLLLACRVPQHQPSICTFDPERTFQLQEHKVKSKSTLHSSSCKACCNLERKTTRLTRQPAGCYYNDIHSSSYKQLLWPRVFGDKQQQWSTECHSQRWSVNIII